MKWNEVIAKDSSLAQDIAAVIGTGTSDYYEGLLRALKLAEAMGPQGFSIYFTENKLPQFRAYLEWRLGGDGSVSTVKRIRKLKREVT